MTKLLKIIWFWLPLLLIALFLFWQVKAQDTTCNIFAKDRAKAYIYDHQYNLDLSDKSKVKYLKKFMKRTNTTTDCILSK